MSSSNNHHEQPKLRRANDAIDTNTLKPPGLLFDEFWRSGEVALLFGAAGAGKSLLAVQLADALSRGRGIAGLQMPSARQNVLYVDLVLSDEQFALRYSREAAKGRRRAYKFAAGLFRDRPPDGASLIEWLRAAVISQKIRTVIVDDLSMISQSDDGTRETLAVVRELRRMTRELGISVLVLADSHPYVFERDIAERDLRRRRVLCAFADSVFAIEATGTTDERVLIQTRAQAGELLWTHRSPANLILDTRDDGFVGFVLDQPELTREERNLIIAIKKMHDDDGESFRSIAHAMDISKSTANRLYSKWNPELECETERSPEESQAAAKYDFPKESYRGEHTDQYLMSIGIRPVWREKHEAELAADNGLKMPSVALPLDVRKSSAFPGGDNKDLGGYASAGGVAAEISLGATGEAELRRTSNGTAEGSRARANARYHDDDVSDDGDRYGLGPLASPSGNVIDISARQIDEPPLLTFDPRCKPFAAGLARRAIRDLEISFDSHGREIYVESREEYTGKPRVWYNRGPGKRFTRFERSSHTIHVQPLGTSGWVP